MLEGDRKLSTFIILTTLTVEAYLLYNIFNNSMLIFALLTVQMFFMYLCYINPLCKVRTQVENINIIEVPGRDEDIEVPTRYVQIEDIKFGNEYGECSICLEENDCNLGRLNCGHVFHKDCIKLWTANNDDCPNCRENVAVYV